MIARDRSVGMTPMDGACTRRWGSRAVLLALLAALLTAPSHAPADGETPGPGVVAPLRNLLAQVREGFPGQVLEVELDREGHGGGVAWVYEVKLLTREGSVVELEYDAATLELLRRKGGHPR